jgi:hypothetical protein
MKRDSRQITLFKTHTQFTIIFLREVYELLSELWISILALNVLYSRSDIFNMISRIPELPSQSHSSRHVLSYGSNIKLR